MGKCYTLALSGGGYRGLFTAHVLSELEKDFGYPIARKFDLIAGTSIGGIIALALALEKPASEIENLFLEHGKEIFKKRRWFSKGWFFKSKYDNKGLKSVLSVLFGEKKIKDLKHRIIVTSVNFTEGKPQIFKTPHHPSLHIDKEKKLLDVALATSAAPTYFPIYTEKTLGDFVDGGLVANHPGVFAMIEAEKFLGYNKDDIYQLHIGTVSQKVLSPATRYMNNSALFAWRTNLINLLFSCQEQSAGNILNFYLRDRYCSIDSDTANAQAKKISLDKVSKQSSNILRQKGDNAVKIYMGQKHFDELKAYSAEDFIQEEKV